MFKANSSHQESEEDEEESSDDDESEASSSDDSTNDEEDKLKKLTIKFGKFLKIKKKNLKDEKLTCLTSKTKNSLKRQEVRRNEKKNQRAKVAYTSGVWGNSSDEEEEYAHLCLMANEVSNSNFDFSFDELQDAFIEMHDELTTLVKALAHSKKRVVSLEKELEKEKSEKEIFKRKLEELENICETHTHTSSCDSCDNLIKEKEELNKVLANITQGTDKSSIILGKQKCVFDKSGVGHNESKENELNSKFFVLTMFSSPFCTYCGKHGHIAHLCNIRRNGLSKNMKWVPKNIINAPGPNYKWVPKYSSSVSCVQINKNEHAGTKKKAQPKKASQRLKRKFQTHKEKQRRRRVPHTSRMQIKRKLHHQNLEDVNSRRRRSLSVGASYAEKKYEHLYTTFKPATIRT